MTPAFMMNMEFIRQEREVPLVKKDTLTRQAIIYIFEHAEARSSELKKHFDIDYSAYCLIHRYIEKGFIVNHKLSCRESIYKIKDGLTPKDFGIED